MASIEDEDFELLLTQLIEKANVLFPSIIKNVKQSDERAKIQKVPWYERHRLIVWVEAAEETRKSYQAKVIVSPWFVAELKWMVEIGSKWCIKPIWKEIEPSLVNSTHFTHTMSKLAIAEHLGRSGHKVEIVPRGAEASPDLMVQAIGGTQDWINIEVYQPSILSGGKDVSPSDIGHIVRQAMKKAKKQLGRKTPGILAVCGFSQKQPIIISLKKSVSERLQKTDRPNLCGIALAIMSVLYLKQLGNISFTPVISFDFIHNPNYFGRVEIDSSPDLDDPNLIKQPLKELPIQDLISNAVPNSNITETNVHPIKEQLKIIEKPPSNTRTVMYSKGNFPIMDGKGNIDFLCGNCQFVVAKKIWKRSLMNIVTKCPSCGTYNEFCSLSDAEMPLVGAIAIEKGEYPLDRTVHTKRGICTFGR